MSRTLEIFKTVAASETNINYTVLMMLRSKTLTSAMPKVMLCSMIDPIHVHEMPRMVYNFIMNSVSLPIFYAVSVFQREMEVPAIPLESVVELFTNGSFGSCCVKGGRDIDRTIACPLREQCHTKRIKDMLTNMLDRRAFLPKDSGMEMRYDTNCMPYITAYGDENDRCDMSSHKLYGRGIRPSSCMRSKSKGGGGGAGNRAATRITTTRRRAVVIGSSSGVARRVDQRRLWQRRRVGCLRSSASSITPSRSASAP